MARDLAITPRMRGLPFKIRPYQSQAVEAALAAINQGKSPLIVCPTGTGKTVILSVIAYQMAQRAPVMIVAHRSEILQQLVEAIRWWTGIKAELEQADQRAYSGHWFNAGRSRIIIASAQTLLTKNKGKLRLTRFDPNTFSCVIFDEAHHYAADQFSKISSYFRVAGVPSVGLTATPDRRDKRGLGHIFDCIAYVYQISDAINDGWLVPVRAFLAPVESINLAWIKTVADDLNASQLAQEMEKEKNVLAVAQPALEFACGLQPSALHNIPAPDWKDVLSLAVTGAPHRVLVFCASVRHAQMLADLLNSVVDGIAMAVWGNMPDNERAAARERLRSGEVRIITNCNLWTEGVDEPQLDVVIMARPTASRALYSQMIGRVMRPLPGLVDNLPTADERKAAIAASAKPYASVLDFVGNSGRHKLVYAPEILAMVMHPAQMQNLVRRARRRMGRILEVVMGPPKDDNELNVLVVPKIKYQLLPTDPYNVYEQHKVSPLPIHKPAPNAPTEHQIRFLLRHGIDPIKLGMDRAECTRIIDEFIRRFKLDKATYRQINFLRKYGIDATDLCRDAASEIIMKIMENRFKPIPLNVVQSIIDKYSHKKP